jgi:hypothetical protein
MQFPVVRLGDMTEGLMVAGLGRSDQTFDRLNRSDRCLGHGPSLAVFWVPAAAFAKSLPLTPGHSKVSVADEHVDVTSYALPFWSEPPVYKSAHPGSFVI